MPIYEGSRYATADVIPVAAVDGVYRATVFPTRSVTEPATYTVHRVTEGDRLELLAHRAYENAELWWVIADANPELIYPDDLVPGTLLKIPVVVT